MRKKLPSTEVLKSHLNYDPDTGKFTWIKNAIGQLCGQKAGTILSTGYVGIVLDNKKYLAHRLAFVWMGQEAPEHTDHINRIKHDNRWCNLRACTRSENSFNRNLINTNKTKYQGVCKERGKFRAQIHQTINGVVRCKFLGYFTCPKEAHEAYRKKVIELHGEGWLPN